MLDGVEFRMNMPSAELADLMGWEIRWVHTENYSAWWYEIAVE